VLEFDLAFCPGVSSLQEFLVYVNMSLQKFLEFVWRLVSKSDLEYVHRQQAHARSFPQDVPKGVHVSALSYFLLTPITESCTKELQG
jgi:hypothetical protein